MIALGCDHGGYELMQEVIKHLEERGLEYKNLDVTALSQWIILYMDRLQQRQLHQENATEESSSAEQESEYPSPQTR